MRRPKMVGSAVRNRKGRARSAKVKQDRIDREFSATFKRTSYRIDFFGAASGKTYRTVVGDLDRVIAAALEVLSPSHRVQPFTRGHYDVLTPPWSFDQQKLIARITCGRLVRRDAQAVR